MSTQFLYTPDAWRFHNQKPDQYINRTQKIYLRIVNKDPESSFCGIKTIRKQNQFSLTKSSGICTGTGESTR